MPRNLIAEYMDRFGQLPPMAVAATSEEVNDDLLRALESGKPISPDRPAGGVDYVQPGVEV